VVLANDRLPSSSSRFQRLARTEQRQLTQKPDRSRIIDE